MGDEGRDEEDWAPPEGSAEEPAGDGEPELAEGDWVEDISDTVAPSVGPHSRVVHHAHAEQEPSDVDAMGLEKRRQVVGGRYGASLARQATLYGAAVAITVAAVVGFILLAGELDKAPDAYEDQAPWSNVDAPQAPPSPLQ